MVLLRKILHKRLPKGQQTYKKALNATDTQGNTTGPSEYLNLSIKCWQTRTKQELCPLQVELKLVKHFEKIFSKMVMHTLQPYVAGLAA